MEYHSTPPASSHAIKIAGFESRKIYELPKGKANIVWRQGRGYLVATVAGRDLIGISGGATYEEVIENVEYDYGKSAADKFRAAVGV